MVKLYILYSHHEHTSSVKVSKYISLLRGKLVKIECLLRHLKVKLNQTSVS